MYVGIHENKHAKIQLYAWYWLTIFLHQAWLYTSPVSVCHKCAAMVYHDPLFIDPQYDG